MNRQEYNKIRSETDEDMVYVNEYQLCPACQSPVELENPDENGMVFWFCRNCKWESQEIEFEPGED